MTTLAQEGSAVAAARGCYLYAIIDGADDRQPLGLTGLDGAETYALAEGGVAAAVSDIAVKKIRPERRRLAAHHEVLKRFLERDAVLPMSFGLIAESPEAVRRILRLNRAGIARELEAVRGKLEMGVRVSWDVSNIFETILAAHTDLRDLRDRMFRGGRQPSHDEMIELGSQFDRRLASDREQYVAAVTAVLDTVCAEVKENKPRNEREVMNIACLVDRLRMADFEHAVREAAGSFDDRFAFDFNGPWPPHNFASLELKTS
jgi:hypothetical protein